MSSIVTVRSSFLMFLAIVFCAGLVTSFMVACYVRSADTALPSTTIADPATTWELAPHEKDALAQLMVLERVGGSTIGDGGEPSSDYQLVRTLRTSLRAVELFAELAADATPAGVVIGLAGLRELDRARYDRELARHESTASSREVIDVNGCFVETTTLATMLERVDAGWVGSKYDL